VHVLARSLRDQRRAIAVWVLSLAALVGMYAGIFPSLRGSSAYAKVFEHMPEGYRALFGLTGGSDITSAAGYLNTELLSFMAPLLVLAYAIGAGANAIAGEEDRGTLEILLANPVRRTRIALEKFGALAAGTVVLCGALFAAVQLEGRATGLDVTVGGSAAAFGQLALLGIEYGALALLVGAATGHLTASRAVPALLAVAAYLLNGLALLSDALKPLRKLSPFYQYIGHDPLHNGTDAVSIVVSAASIAVLVGLALVAFNRRDVNAR